MAALTTAYIHLWHKRVGAVAWNEQEGIADMEYDPAFIREGWDIAPIQMPITGSRATIFSVPALRRRSRLGK